MHKNNSFDLLRLLLGVAVLITHGVYLLAIGLIDPLMVFSKGQIDLGQLAVVVFFSLSGYLITSSFLRSKNYLEYLINRILRIFPGFWIALLISAFLIAPGIYYLRYHTFENFKLYGENSSSSYFVKNLFLQMHQYHIEKIDEAHYNPSYALNGSLWTLYPEFQCYIFTLLAGLCGLFHKNKAVLLFLTFAAFVLYMLKVVFRADYGPSFIMLTPYLKFYITYLIGSLMCVYSNLLVFDKKAQLFLFLVSLLLLRFGGFALFAPFLIPALAISVFSGFAIPLKYDVSYGLYIYAFPVTILVHYAFSGSIPFLTQLLIALCLTLIIAFLSFICIERPFLKMKSHFKRVKGYRFFQKDFPSF